MGMPNNDELTLLMEALIKNIELIVSTEIPIENNESIVSTEIPIENNEPTFSTVKQFSQKDPAFPESGLRWLIFNAATNGLDKYEVIVRCGRRVLINTSNFYKWLKHDGGHRS